MIAELEARFPEYRRKKKRSFRRSVEKCYSILRQDLGIPSSDSETIVDEDDDMPQVLEEVYADIQKTSMNSSISKLYHSGASSAAQGSPAKKPRPSNAVRRNNEESTASQPKKKRSKGIDVSPEIPSVKFCDVGGAQVAVKEIKRLVFHMEHPEVFAKIGVSPPRGFLLHGPPGSGKTLLGRAVAGELGIPLIKVAATEMISGVSGESEGRLRDVFEAALNAAPCVLFIDEIDSITPKRETAGKEMERRVVAQLVSCLDDMACHVNGSKVVVVGATSRPDSLDPGLRRGGRFDREISLGIPDMAARKEILHILCADLTLAPNFDFDLVARRTPGFVGADLASLTREAAMIAVNRSFSNLEAGTELTLCVTDEDFVTASKTVQPSAKREGFATVPDVTWDDVGALSDIREELEVSIMAPVKFPEQFEALGLGNPSGVLLCGPPGCGKTLLAKAVANEANINFISVKGPELLNMYVGESERAVRACFVRARNSAPCVIFFDELDSLCPKRSSGPGGDGASGRVVNQLLTEMDGVGGRKGVFVMAATNRPDILDPAVLRPGRLDKILYVGLPCPDDRADIIFALTAGGTKPKLKPGVDLAAIARSPRCDGFSGADLAALVREASVAALKEILKFDSETSAKPGIVSVGNEHFDFAFEKVSPSNNPEERKKYEALRDKLNLGKFKVAK
ncbi:unnamed protein product [Notodromas monacha]|uniref:AAA+ ATPase domain-containing protein n=1 Tax=Notodromas monacha TaxID=399045 RepID=A0A7R9BRE5_9CRUS|nr:unnamed protein product [Notodromas monacha]CAG0920314.1 unnamed protein product [Notodromas monacha]